MLFSLVPFCCSTQTTTNKLSTSAFVFFNRKIPSAMDAEKKKNWNRKWGKWGKKSFQVFPLHWPIQFPFYFSNSQPYIFFTIYAPSYSSLRIELLFTEVLFIDTKKKILKLMVSLQKLFVSLSLIIMQLLFLPFHIPPLTSNSISIVYIDTKNHPKKIYIHDVFLWIIHILLLLLEVFKRKQQQQQQKKIINLLLLRKIA